MRGVSARDVGKIYQVEHHQAMDNAAFALVPLVDETKLMALFSSQSTHLQFVEHGVGTGQMPPAEDRFVRISLLDLGENRMTKLSKGLHPYYWPEIEPEDAYHEEMTATIFAVLEMTSRFLLSLQRRLLFQGRRQ